VEDRAVTLTRRWLDAYAAHRDDEMLELAHPAIVVRPRRGQGRREYRGISGVKRWLAEADVSRYVPDDLTIRATRDGRSMVELTVEGVPIVAMLDFREDKVSGVNVYLSDRGLLESLDAIS
jgi:hypothetical protein